MSWNIINVFSEANVVGVQPPIYYDDDAEERAGQNGARRIYRKYTD